MKWFILVFNIVLLTISFNLSSLFSQTIHEYVDFDTFKQEVLDEKTEGIHVINFWATWCKPCVEEMPHFLTLKEAFSSEITFTFVSLDFPENLSKLIDLSKKLGIAEDVVLLSDENANSWIDQVDGKWSGALPMTIMKKGDFRQTILSRFRDYPMLLQTYETFKGNID